VSNLRQYFDTVGKNPSTEANALKEQVGETVKYLDSIVQLFDQVAVQAVENFQKTTGTDEVALDSAGNDDVQYQSRNHRKYSYKNISQQEYRQIQEDRMEKYGSHFDEMPIIDYTHAHDQLYVFENFDETRFGVLEIIDPAKNKTKADIVVEAFGNGPVQNIQDLNGRITRLRNFQKLRSVYHSNARNGGTGTGNAGLGAGPGGASNGNGMPGDGNGNKVQHQQRTNTLTDREVLVMAAEQIELSNLTPEEKDALRTFQMRHAELKNLQVQMQDQQEQTNAALNEDIQKRSQELAVLEKQPLLQQVRNKALPVIEAQLLAEQKARLEKYRKQYGTIPSVGAADSEGYGPLSPADIADAAVNGEPVGPAKTAQEAVKGAVALAKESGKVSNSQATRILQTPGAVEYLQQYIDITLPGTASGNRAAIKNAVMAIANTHGALDVDENQSAPDPVKDTDAWLDTIIPKAPKAEDATQGNIPETTESNTKAISKPIEAYPPQKQHTIRQYLRAVDNKIKSFVQRVKGGDLSFHREKISDVTDRMATDIKNILGIDVTGYTNNINTNGIKHTLIRHGESGKQDFSMAVDDDIARVGWVLDNYDKVELLTENGQQVYSSEFHDKNNHPAPQIRFVKRIDGNYYVVEAVCENQYKKYGFKVHICKKMKMLRKLPLKAKQPTTKQTPKALLLLHLLTILYATPTKLSTPHRILIPTLRPLFRRPHPRLTRAPKPITIILQLPKEELQMAQDKQLKPMMTEAQKKMLWKAMEEDQHLMKTNPEYRVLWEKREKDLQRFIFPEDNPRD